MGYTIIFIHDLEGYEFAFIVDDQEADSLQEQVENKVEGEYYVLNGEEFLVEEVSNIEYYKVDFGKIRGD